MANPVLEVGAALPAFELEADDGSTVNNASLKGQRTVIYFYPKDDTPGCTTQACDFRDNLKQLDGVKVQVYGVSPDSVASHLKFKKKYDLTFPLLADVGRKMATDFGVFRERNRYGKMIKGIVRSTFVVDADGKLEQIFDNVRAKGHVERLIKAL